MWIVRNDEVQNFDGDMDEFLQTSLPTKGWKLLNCKYLRVPHIIYDQFSYPSLFLELVSNGTIISKATGFIIETFSEDRPELHLVTNWHVVSGRNSDTDELLDKKTGAIPDSIRIYHHSSKSEGGWVVKTESLYSSDGDVLWKEHPKGRYIDVALLPLTEISDDIAIYPFERHCRFDNAEVKPSRSVSIIGFPFGLKTNGQWPIWKTGHIASDIEFDYDDRPAFLIDATTRQGMSGSPVVLRIFGEYFLKDGSLIKTPRGITMFLGIYSGRIHKDSEIGRVWRPVIIEEIINARTQK